MAFWEGGGLLLTKYILQHFCNNETSFSYRIDFYYTYWFDDFSPAKETIKNMYKTGIYIMYMYVHTLISHDKCFEIPTCTDNLNKQILVTGSGFLIDVHGTHGL